MAFVSAGQFCPAGPVELRLPPPATCTKRPNFTDTATEFCRQLPNFSDRDTEFRRQSYRILPTEIPNFADRDTEFCLQKRGGKRAHLFTVSQKHGTRSATGRGGLYLSCRGRGESAPLVGICIRISILRAVVSSSTRAAPRHCTHDIRQETAKKEKISTLE